MAQATHCGLMIKGTRAEVCPKCDYQFNGKQVAAAEPVTAEKPVKAGDTITIGQIRTVTQTVKAVGGVDRVNELLGIVKEVGGVKKFKDLLEAMGLTGIEANQN